MLRRLIIAAVLLLGACGGGMPAINTPQKAPDDQTIATRVRTSLLNAPSVHADQIKVDVASGVVTLSGTVQDQKEVDAAVAATRKVEGVRDVKVDLHTKGGAALIAPISR